MSSAPLLRAVSVGKRYESGAGAVDALRDFSLTAEAGDFIVLMGRSGSGKSTALHLLGAMDLPSSGAVYLDGESTAQPEPALTYLRRRAVGFVFQAFHLLPTLSVRENLELPLLIDPARRLPAAERARRVAALLEQVELEGHGEAFPHQLSGGEMQRVAVARALIHRPRVVIADEPTGNLDEHSAESVMRLLERLAAAEGAAVILATHNPEAARRASAVIQLRDGEIVARSEAARQKG